MRRNTQNISKNTDNKSGVTIYLEYHHSQSWSTHVAVAVTVTVAEAVAAVGAVAVAVLGDKSWEPQLAGQEAG